MNQSLLQLSQTKPISKKIKKKLFPLPKQGTGQYSSTYVSLGAQLSQLMCHSSTNIVLTIPFKKLLTM